MFLAIFCGGDGKILPRLDGYVTTVRVEGGDAREIGVDLREKTGRFARPPWSWCR